MVGSSRLSVTQLQKGPCERQLLDTNRGPVCAPSTRSITLIPPNCDRDAIGIAL